MPVARPVVVPGGLLPALERYAAGLEAPVRDEPRDVKPAEPKLEAPRPPKRPLVLKKWKAPGPANPDDHDARLTRVFVSPDGSRVVTRSNAETICWDALSGQGLRAFRPEKGVKPRSPNDTKVLASGPAAVSLGARAMERACERFKKGTSPRNANVLIHMFFCLAGGGAIRRAGERFPAEPRPRL